MIVSMMIMNDSRCVTIHIYIVNTHSDLSSYIVAVWLTIFNTHTIKEEQEHLLPVSCYSLCPHIEVGHSFSLLCAFPYDH